MPPLTVREQVTTLLRDQLVAGMYPGGHVLREVELAKRLGVSRGPVRDAFLQLTQEGFLAYAANRGVTVKHPPNMRNRKFIVSLRTQIETFAVKTGLADMTDEAMQQVEEALMELKRACSGDNPAAVARSDMEFHKAILLGCGGEDFLEAWRQLCSKMLMTYSRLGNYHEVYDEHLKIWESVKKRDKDAVIEALKDNIR